MSLQPTLLFFPLVPVNSLEMMGTQWAQAVSCREQSLFICLYFVYNESIPFLVSTISKAPALAAQRALALRITAAAGDR